MGRKEKGDKGKIIKKQAEGRGRRKGKNRTRRDQSRGRDRKGAKRHTPKKTLKKSLNAI